MTRLDTMNEQKPVLPLGSPDFPSLEKSAERAAKNMQVALDIIRGIVLNLIPTCDVPCIPDSEAEGLLGRIAYCADMSEAVAKYADLTNTLIGTCNR